MQDYIIQDPTATSQAGDKEEEDDEDILNDNILEMSDIEDPNGSEAAPSQDSDLVGIWGEF